MKPEKVFYSLLAKALTEKLDPAEQSELKKIIEENAALNNEYFSLKEFWLLTKPEKISHRIIEKTEKRLNFTSRHKTGISILYKIAAAVLLILSLGVSGYLYYQQKNTPVLTEYRCNFDEIKEFTLSDGTSVSLNSNSYLLTMEPFGKGSREIRLYGEAYFKVKHENNKPFVIHTPGLQTKVLGTTLNISAWPNSHMQEIELYEGKIQLQPEENSSGAVTLSPGERAHFNSLNSDLNVSENMKGQEAAWRHGILSFHNEKLSLIATALEQKFQTRILILDEEAENLRYTGDFEEESLEKILLMLNRAKKFDFSISAQAVIIRSVTK